MRASRGERGQAMAETALFSMMAVLMAFALISLIPIHRIRTAAAAAAYACAEFISQSPNPEWAAWSAYQVARQTLNTDWSATLGTEYQIEVAPPAGPGKPAGCVVRYLPPLLFNIFDIQLQWDSEFFVSRSETWKAKWR